MLTSRPPLNQRIHGAIQARNVVRSGAAEPPFDISGANALKRPLIPQEQWLAQVSKILDEQTSSVARPGNVITPYIDAEEVLPALRESIQKAKRSVFVQVFDFFRGDTSSNLLTQDLLKTHRGTGGKKVPVFVLADAIGSHDLPGARNKNLRTLARAGAQVVVFNPVTKLKQIFHREHAKVVIADDEGWMGGMNFADKYLGPPDTKGRVHDVFLKIRGPLVADMAQQYARDMKASEGKEIPPELANPKRSPPLKEGVLARVVHHEPGDKETIGNLYKALIDKAQHKIVLENSFPLRQDILDSIVKARARGVEVTIVLSFKGLNGVAERSRFSALQKAGVKIKVLERESHTKALFVDDAICAVGSSNVDSASLAMNRERMLVIQDPDFTQAFAKRLVEKDIATANQLLKTNPDPLREPLWQKALVALVEKLWPAQYQ